MREAQNESMDSPVFLVTLYLTNNNNIDQNDIRILNKFYMSLIHFLLSKCFLKSSDLHCIAHLNNSSISLFVGGGKHTS